MRDKQAIFYFQPASGNENEEDTYLPSLHNINNDGKVSISLLLNLTHYFFSVFGQYLSNITTATSTITTA